MVCSTDGTLLQYRSRWAYMPSHSLETHRELGCLDKSRVRVKLVEVPANARELGPPNLYEGGVLVGVYDISMKNYR